MNIINDFPSILVLLPIIFSIVGILVNKEKLSLYSLVTLHFILAVFLFFAYIKIGISKEIRYFFGGWKAPYGIEFVVNKPNLVFLSLLFFTSFSTTLFSFKDLNFFIGDSCKVKFISIFMICLSGFAGMILTNDIFNLYVFLEISSISAYTLASIGGRKSIKPAIDYLIVGTFAATIFLLGIGFIYLVTGTLNITDISGVVINQNYKNLYFVGIGLMTIGLFIKFAIFPFHRWMISIYENSNFFITIFFSAISTKVMLFVLFKLKNQIFKIDSVSVHSVDDIFLSFSALAIIGMGITAVLQDKLRSILSYSSASQIGYMLMAITISTKTNYKLFMSYMLIHSLAKMGLFMQTSIIDKNRDSGASLILFLSFVVAGSAIIGIPGTGGFIVKLNLILEFLKLNNWVVSGIIILGSVMSIYYFWPPFEQLYTANLQKSKNTILLNINQKIVLIIVSIIIILLGIFPNIFQIVLD